MAECPALTAATRTLRVLLAAPRAYCAGVRRAVEIVERALDDSPGPVYVRKQIVHNSHVVGWLESQGAIFVDELDEVPDGALVVFSAHGVAPSVRAEAARRRLRVIDATCPLVAKVHAEARRFASRGDTVVMIGHAGHEEVEGTFGEAPRSMTLVESVADVERLEVPDPARVSYLTQTTLAVDETATIIAALRRRFPAVRGPASSDICYAATNRQAALEVIAAESDLVLVVGSANSSNTARLVELARRNGCDARLIEDADAIDPGWLDRVDTVGLTAGASAPPILVDQVVETLGRLRPIRVAEYQAVEEDVHFVQPKGSPRT